MYMLRTVATRPANYMIQEVISKTIKYEKYEWERWEKYKRLSLRISVLSTLDLMKWKRNIMLTIMPVDSGTEQIKVERGRERDRNKDTDRKT